MKMIRLIQHNKNSISWHMYAASNNTFKNMEVFFCKEDEQLIITERSANRYQVVIEKPDKTFTPLADFPISNTIIMYEDNIETNE